MQALKSTGSADGSAGAAAQPARVSAETEASARPLRMLLFI